MDLKDVLYQMMQENTAAGQPTDLRVGTVTRDCLLYTSDAADEL